jgi:hypothetical protein
MVMLSSISNAATIGVAGLVIGSGGGGDLEVGRQVEREQRFVPGSQVGSAKTREESESPA